MEDFFSISTDKSALIKVLETVHRDSCPSRFNFHLHTQCSDGQCQPIDLFQQAIALGLKGLAITDHHSIDAFFVVRQWLLEKDIAPESVPQLWTGVEITGNLLDTDVHILGLAYDPNVICMKPYLTGESVQGSLRSADAVVDAIHEAGGLAVLAHPVRYRKSPEALIERGAEIGLDGVESFYCYGSDHPWSPSEPQTDRVQSLGDRFNLLSTCGTDTHGLDITRRR